MPSWASVRRRLGRVGVGDQRQRSKYGRHAGLHLHGGDAMRSLRPNRVVEELGEGVGRQDLDGFLWRFRTTGSPRPRVRSHGETDQLEGGRLARQLYYTRTGTTLVATHADDGDKRSLLRL